VEPPEKRRSVRRLTSWKADCRLDSGSLLGDILDINAYGAFFAPDAAHDADALARLVTPNQKVALTFRDAGLDGLELPARIRWIGYSAAHGRVGFGVQFSHAPMPVT
jgi:hypothetical protein